MLAVVMLIGCSNSPQWDECEPYSGDDHIRDYNGGELPWRGSCPDGYLCTTHGCNVDCRTWEWDPDKEWSDGSMGGWDATWPENADELCRERLGVDGARCELDGCIVSCSIDAQCPDDSSCQALDGRSARCLP
jgi:hypothetical protein